mgnify:FL=1
MDKENLIIKIQKDIVEAEAMLKEAKDELQKQQDTLFCLRVEANALIQEAYSRPNGVNDAN